MVDGVLVTRFLDEISCIGVSPPANRLLVGAIGPRLSHWLNIQVAIRKIESMNESIHLASFSFFFLVHIGVESTAHCAHIEVLVSHQQTHRVKEQVMANSGQRKCHRLLNCSCLSYEH